MSEEGKEPRRILPRIVAGTSPVILGGLSEKSLRKYSDALNTMEDRVKEEEIVVGAMYLAEEVIRYKRTPVYYEVVEVNVEAQKVMVKVWLDRKKKNPLRQVDNSLGRQIRVEKPINPMAPIFDKKNKIKTE